MSENLTFYNPSVTALPCHLPLHKGGYGTLRCHSSRPRHSERRPDEIPLDSISRFWGEPQKFDRLRMTPLGVCRGGAEATKTGGFDLILAERGLNPRACSRTSSEKRVAGATREDLIFPYNEDLFIPYISLDSAAFLW